MANPTVTAKRNDPDPAHRDPGGAEVQSSGQRSADESAARARAIVNTAPDAIITFDETGAIDSFNPAAEPMFACAAEDAVGRPISQFLPDLGREALATEEFHGLVERETLARRTDGSLFPADLSVTEMRLGGRRVFTAFVRDITERKRTEEELRAYAARLQRSNRELQDFAYVASHDLQEPLRKIQAFSERFATRCAGELSEQGRTYLERIHNAAARMQALINDLLAFSRVTTRGQPFARVDLNEIARSVLDDLEARIEETGARVEIGRLPVLEADPAQMRQLLQNLLANALKFRKPDRAPHVRVHARAVDVGKGSAGPRRHWVLSVEDNGIGFDPKYAERIFTIFQRLHSRTEYEGTGVGLAICQRIAERHGGSISAEGRPGEGAAFRVVLPERQTGGPQS